jgi:ADP-ribose pyrophosphatase YjhB (NUDIX family)
MTVVQKSSVICVKAFGLHWRGRRLLAFEVYDHEGRLKGVRPLGGSVEFGESAEDAVIREFKEEIDVEVSILAGPMVLENVFFHDGQRRHEILFIFDVAFPPRSFTQRASRPVCLIDENSWRSTAQVHDQVINRRSIGRSRTDQRLCTGIDASINLVQ